jgi:transcriptional regulator with PAS, ATPase and Fis domain
MRCWHRGVRHVLERSAQIDSNVLVTGESGTGKEEIARALHEGGHRRGKPFVPVNMGSLTEALAESRLFGHEAGAFTGANKKQPGLFLQAHGGTLFLDEVGEMSPPVQVLLLRALQERKIRPIGAAQEISVDVRVVAATHRDLMAMVRQGTFREDLYYRLTVVRIALPPLRERKDDIPAIAKKTLEELRKNNPTLSPTLSKEVLTRLKSHSWPGNIRELKNVIECAMVTATGEIKPEDLVFNEGPRDEAMLPEKERNNREFKRLYELHGNVKKVAELLGISESTAHLRLKALEALGEIVRRRRR